MPTLHPFAKGTSSTASSVVTKRGRASLTNIAANSLTLLTQNMPHIVCWFSQTSGANPATVKIQGMVRATNSPGGGPEWLDLNAPVNLIPGGTPVLIDIVFPAQQIRAVLTPNTNPTIVEYVLTSSAAT